MAHFIAHVQGSYGPAPRIGGKSSGIRASAAGWDVGARILITHEDGRDRVRVYRTSGSNGFKSEKLIADYYEGDE